MKDSWSIMHQNVRCREIRCAAPLKVEPGLKNKIICHRLSPTIWANWTDFQLSSLERQSLSQYHLDASFILFLYCQSVSTYFRGSSNIQPCRPVASATSSASAPGFCLPIHQPSTLELWSWKMFLVDKRGNPWDALRCDMTWQGPNGHDIGDYNMETCNLWQDREPRAESVLTDEIRNKMRNEHSGFACLELTYHLIWIFWRWYHEISLRFELALQRCDELLPALRDYHGSGEGHSNWKWWQCKNIRWKNKNENIKITK